MIQLALHTTPSNGRLRSLLWAEALSEELETPAALLG